MRVSGLFFFVVIFLFSCTDSTVVEPDYNNPKNLNISDLLKAADTMQKLLNNTAAGSSEGQYPADERTELQNRLTEVRIWLKDDLPDTDQRVVDEYTDACYSACTAYEASVISAHNDLIDPHATRETRYLYVNFGKYAPERLLFGMHDATGYGVGWSGDDNRSDVKEVCGSYPAVFSWDVHGIINDPDLSRFEYRMLLAYENGINTLCWHQIDPEGHGFYYDQVNYDVVTTILPGGKYHENYKEKLHKFAGFMKRLRGPRGESVPVIFRPYHEQNGNWFWWGRIRCTEQEYIDLWRFTVTYLRDTLHVHNLIYAFSPDGNQFSIKSDYLREYPGDDYVDIFGVDFYFWEAGSETYLRFQQRLLAAVQNAQEHGKLAALTEVGDEKVDIPQWYTQYLLAPIKNNFALKYITYAAVWRNANPDHHYAPYPGHAAVPDFVAFYDDPFTVFASDLVNVYVLESGL